LRLPLIWPERYPEPAQPVLRAAAYATQFGAADRFALAAFRLAFCGGFDLEDPEMLTEAAAAAELPLDGVLAATRNPAYDRQPRATAEGLAARGVRCLPAMRIRRQWFEGQDAAGDAAALLRTLALYGDLAPVG
jgi:2-hydroxychromene-2-carboxylate isomerase